MVSDIWEARLGPILKRDMFAPSISCTEMKHKPLLKKCSQCQFLRTWKKQARNKWEKKKSCFLAPHFVCFPFKTFFFVCESYWALLCLLLKKPVMFLRVLWQCVISGQSLSLRVNSRRERGCPARGWSNSSESDGVMPTLYYGNRSSLSCTNNS